MSEQTSSSESPLRQILAKSLQGQISAKQTWSEWWNKQPPGKLQDEYNKLAELQEGLKAKAGNAPSELQARFVAFSGKVDELKNATVAYDDAARAEFSRQVKAQTKTGTELQRDINYAASRPKQLTEAEKKKLIEDDKKKLTEFSNTVDECRQKVSNMEAVNTTALRNLSNIQAWAKDYKGDRPLSDKQRDQLKNLPDIKKAFDEAAAIQAIETARSRLIARLDGLLPAAAAKADLAPNATEQDLAPLLETREKIAAALRKHVTAESELAEPEQQIKTLATQVGNARKALDALQAEQDELRDEEAALVDPTGCTDATDKAIVAKRTLLQKALADRATTDSVKAARTALVELEKLVAQGEGEIKDARKQFAARIDPVRKEFRKLVAAFQDLGIGSTDQLDEVKRDEMEIADLLKAANWEDAAKRSDALRPKLAPQQKLAEEMSEFRGGSSSKLLQGTYDKAIKVVASSGPVTIAAVKAKLAQVYDQQCSVKRQNWLEFLGIAGANVKVGGDQDHYTTFNNAVLQGKAELSVDQSVDEVCRQLFQSVDSTSQVHSTVTKGGSRYHKYWDGTESWNVGADGLAVSDKGLYDKMVARWNQLKSDMRKKVDEAKKAHGRIGNATAGPDVT